MNDIDELKLILEHREHQWLQHCKFVLEKILLPICHEGLAFSQKPSERAAVLIENRIDHQWLFTVLNTWLMCPQGTEILLITDRANLSKASTYLHQHAPDFEAHFLCVEDLLPGTNLSNYSSFNRMLKTTAFWSALPHEELLIIQTDALLAKPLEPFFFQFCYLGAPFLPRQHSEYFEKRDKSGHINRFFKIETPIHNSPHPDTYPHLHGNGGLSIRHRTVMAQACKKWGENSPEIEAEDVFFSRYVPQLKPLPPLEIAQAFATETTYNPMAVGSHACWKFLHSRDLADHLSQHLRSASSMANALRQES
ncbi:DUF5672 family protein [Synechococcus sp. MU1642]|uniref:DUF5672 family protein n=1 Tax=Synechococcus sp. MU1642 TaxID=2508348 RepID=UPI001CF920D7|nr:DUF5672 family protein [Synechococcus sp. MU1642]MCB4406948.1 hypothetical protein [Synechococcus sp. MU1642]